MLPSAVTVLRVNDIQALWKANKRKISSNPLSLGAKYKTMIYSFPHLVLSCFTWAQIITPPYSRESGFQQGSISKLDAGVGPVPQDEGKPIPSSIWETVTVLPNEDTGYGLVEWGLGGDQKSQRQSWTPQTGRRRCRVNICICQVTLFWFN